MMNAPERKLFDLTEEHLCLIGDNQCSGLMDHVTLLKELLDTYPQEVQSRTPLGRLLVAYAADLAMLAQETLKNYERKQSFK